MNLIDTHCHIHDSEFAEKFGKPGAELLKNAIDAGVTNVICVGTDVKSSREAVEFCKNQKNAYPTIALHPHEAAEKSIEELNTEFKKLQNIIKQHRDSIVAIGECGLDYYYHDSEETRKKQKEVFRWHLDLAEQYNLPLVFHVRDAFSDFFSILDDYSDVRGVVHSFTAGPDEAREVVKRGLYAGLNGIMTFTKDSSQLETARLLPIENILLETDAPFLTPNPLRGTINEPKHVILITQFLSKLRDESQALLAKTTTQNAKELFNL